MSKDGRYVLVSNGEIYNFIELCSELEPLRHVFLYKNGYRGFIEGLNFRRSFISVS
jgi:hypothetical protein